MSYISFQTNMAQTKSYANFNSITVQGRVFAAEIAENNGGEFLALTLITNLVNGDAGMTVTLNNSNGLMGLFNKGYLPIGRMLTIVGHVASVTSTYEKGGKTYDLKRPKMHLTGAVLLDGGLGPAPKDADMGSKAARRTPDNGRPAIDQTPAVSGVTGSQPYGSTPNSDFE